MQLPDLGRYRHGRRDARLLSLGRLCPRLDDLPQIVGERLDTDGCVPADLEDELHRLSHELGTAYSGSGLPAVTPTPDDSARVAVIGMAAAAPLWQLALQAIAELDATFIATGTDDFAAWDAAVSEPIARWAAEEPVAGDHPPLRELTTDAIAAHEVALRTQLGWSTDDAEGRRALAAVWDRALGLATHASTRAATELVGAVDAAPGIPDAVGVVRALTAVSELRDAMASRRRGLAALGAALDDAVGDGPTTEIALALAARAVFARALVGGVADWLADLAPVPTAHPTLERVRVEAERVAAVEHGLAHHLARTHAAVAGLIGMDA